MHIVQCTYGNTVFVWTTLYHYPYIIGGSMGLVTGYSLPKGTEPSLILTLGF
jgi:hypothetical protein